MSAAGGAGDRPLLSVIVTIVDGGAATARCLRALASQVGGPPLEVIVPFDSTAKEGASLARQFPAFHFLDLGRLTVDDAVVSRTRGHVYYDLRRSAGLAAARGDLVSIIEDRGAPRPDWAARFEALHRAPHEVVGGAVVNVTPGPLGWAVFVCDLGRYMPPFEAGPREYVTDINVCYKRAALERTRELWREAYRETTVHWALQSAGTKLHLDPGPVVEHLRAPETFRWGPLLAERFSWGRIFGESRVLGASRGRLAALTVGSLLLPAALLLRHARVQRSRGVGWGRVALAAPCMFPLLCAWSLGETAAYASGVLRPRPAATAGAAS